jgi:hypothetical protein
MEQVNHLQGQQKMRQAAPRKYDGENGNPYYNPENGGHYGTSARRAASRPRPPPVPVTFTMLTFHRRRLCIRMCFLRTRLLTAADIWSRLQHKTMPPTRSSSPVPGRM